MRKILFAMISCFVALCSHAAQMANLDYIHKLIQQKWDITVPIKADNPMLAANMKYLLTAIDVANEILNGEKTTDYGNGEFATLQAADTVATNAAVETLIKKERIEPFCFYDDYGEEAYFTISASGVFTIDCGGVVETITKTNTDTISYQCPRTVNLNKVCIAGKATGYGDSPAFTMGDCNGGGDRSVYKVSGQLGKIFPTLADGTQPSFKQAFLGCTIMKEIPDDLFKGIKGQPRSRMFEETFHMCMSLTSIPENLFAGISGAPASYMFYQTFSGCSGLTSIPDGLFAGISGAPASYMFNSTFSDCYGLTSIPENLFAGISGAPAIYMFANTFDGCRGLTSIPAGLFAGISGAPAEHMFSRTFYGCRGLTSIPENLFGNISGTAQSYMFKETFKNCTSLTGPSARINGQYLYEIWPSATSVQVSDMYYKATGLSDYATMPTVWK